MGYALIPEETPGLFECFYTTPRASADLLSDGGGPFGFDIHAAIAVDTIIQKYGIKNIVETGTSRGDTAEYLARLYPEIEIDTIEINKELASFAKLRLRKYSNVNVHCGDSAEILKNIAEGKDSIMYYLDAHGLNDWPLLDEIKSLQNKSFIVIDDFDVGEDPFHYDTYDGVKCDMSLVGKFFEDNQRIYTVDISYKFKYPCLQMMRRGGKIFIPKNLSHTYMLDCPMFKEINYA